jgi:putative transposase
MKKVRFTEEQMVTTLREPIRRRSPRSRRGTRSASRRSTTGVAVSARWNPWGIKRLRALESENAKPKRILAERDLEIDTFKEINRRKW